jgi:hypothetical protein
MGRESLDSNEIGLGGHINLKRGSFWRYPEPFTKNMVSRQYFVDGPLKLKGLLRSGASKYGRQYKPAPV